MIKEKYRGCFCMVGPVGFGGNNEDIIDPRGFVQRANMFTLVAPTPHYLIPPKTFQRPQLD